MNTRQLLVSVRHPCSIRGKLAALKQCSKEVGLQLQGCTCHVSPT
jgi:hypothetical protein